VIHYQMAPREPTVEQLKSPPSILLIGSPKPESPAAAAKVAIGAIFQAVGPVKERDFLGRKIETISVPGQQGGFHLDFAASGGYVAFSTDSAMVEEYLRSGDGATKPLRDTPGLADAVQKAGGAGSGFFAYDNQYEGMKAAFGLVHGSSFSLSDLLSAPAIPGAPNPADKFAAVNDWADFSLLPSFDAISKYFYFSVQSLRLSPEGFTLTVFVPTPPKLH
jgi:hypothetical protein